MEHDELIMRKQEVFCSEDNCAGRGVCSNTSDIFSSVVGVEAAAM